MSTNLRRLMILLVGVLLLVAPLFTRVVINRLNQRAYQPPAVGLADLVATPVPTSTAMPAPQDVTPPDDELSPGPVLVDMAHFSQLNPGQFESLAAALAARGVSLRFWLSSIEPSEINSFQNFPDQSEALAPLLQDARALVVVSPLFLWAPAEVAQVETFVADGGRLLLISDPDVLGDAPWNSNSLGEPFGVVFNDDYLYDLSQNDSNYTHFFQGEFLDRAAALSGSTIAFYGARSIGGPVVSQARSAGTTLSSLRSGLTSFTTVAIGGRETNGTAGNVLAMGDFDVLTEPYIARHDNHAMLEFVADFLVGGQRVQTLPDFPAYLGKQVTLVFVGDVSMDAELLQQGGLLQRRLDEAGRVLTLSGSTSLTPATRLTGTVALKATPSVAAATGGTEPQDLIYISTFESADEETSLLADAGIRLVEDIQTPEAAETPPAGAGESGGEGGIEQPVPAVTPTLEPEGTLLLETDSGLRLLAAETVLILQKEQADGSRAIAVLGFDSKTIIAGLDRLLFHRFDDCLNFAEMSICPFFAEGGPDEGGGWGEPSAAGAAVLVVDDNDLAAPGEASEAAFYLQVLTDAGYTPAMWSSAESGSPGEADLAGYDWVIWSGGLYETSGPDIDEQDTLWRYVYGGGRLSISGRNHPFVGEGLKDASGIADVVKTDEVPELVVGFPDEPIDLPPDLPPVVPIQIEPNDNGADVLVALRRGPNSADPGAPLVVAVTGTGEPDPIEIRVLVMGMPLNWLPDGYAVQLVQNMASWMLAEQ